MAAKPSTEGNRDGGPSRVEWYRDARLPLGTGGVMLVSGIILILISKDSALSGGVVAAAGAVLVVSWARRASALGNRAKRALLGLELALLVACLGLFVWHAQTAWGWF